MFTCVLTYYCLSIYIYTFNVSNVEHANMLFRPLAYLEIYSGRDLDFSFGQIIMFI